MDSRLLCRNCKGKGHVFWGASMLTPFAWFLAPFETNDPDGLTRRECPKCRGNGFICTNVLS